MLARRTALLSCLVLIGCPQSGGPDDDFAPKGGHSAHPVPTMSAQRPTRVYFIEHEDRFCYAYWTDGEQRSVKRQEKCPRELEPGERVRLLGRTCMRESDKTDRNVPTRCPRPLYKAAEHDRAGKGEMRLRPEATAGNGR